jgi:glutathione-regulated potassium-efflux system protein KefB
VIGLEMKPARLWKLRGEIFGLGVAQVAVCSALLTGIGILAGFPPAIAFVAGAGFVLTSTAVVLQLLAERGEMSALPHGQKVVSILLLEDLADRAACSPLVAFLSPPVVPPEAGFALPPRRDRHRHRGRRSAA